MLSPESREQARRDQPNSFSVYSVYSVVYPEYMVKISEQFIRKIPKTDLHLHLDGSLRLPSLIEMAEADGIELPSYEEQGLNELVFKERYANPRRTADTTERTP